MIYLAIIAIGALIAAAILTVMLRTERRRNKALRVRLGTEMIEHEQARAAVERRLLSLSVANKSLPGVRPVRPIPNPPERN